MTGPTIALYKPEIPPNTGNISRLCVAINSPLYLIGKLGFDIDDKTVKRAGLDHWQHLNLRRFNKFKDLKVFNITTNQNRIIAITKEGHENHFDFNFYENDILLFGNETKGLPPALLKLVDHQVKIPMWGKVRSLNLANSVSIIAYEYLRQMQNLPSAKDYARTYFKK